MSDLHNRRTFLRAAAAAGATWAAADIARVEDALVWAADSAAGKNARQFKVLTPGEAGAIAAVAARIVPSVDGHPGASEAGVIYFIDHSLATFNGAQRKLYADGAKDLDARAASKKGGTVTFAALAPTQQDELLREVEDTPFFNAVRFDTIAGMFALPSWGGNREFAGWRLLGMTHQARFDPPFGYYDAEASKGS